MVAITSYLVPVLCVATATFAAPASIVARSQDCKYLPQDSEWPSVEKWQELNKTVGGRLIGGKPLARVCFGDEYNEASCQEVESRWTDISFHMDDPVSIQAPYWQNNSCTPFAPKDGSCTLGNLASYAINVSSAEDVMAGVKFARDNNIRLSVKNTGHDYIGRSAGQGSLSLWMHHMKNLTFFDYSSTYYNGTAARLSAGMQAYEVYPAAEAKGVRVIGGFCPTVGLAGGYVQGAGHGPLASTYGLAADNTLEFEVVTIEGKHLIANPNENSDLYWALSGGGGGTYAVVLSVTSKTYPDGPVGGASLSFNNTEDDLYWSTIAVWQKHVLDFDRIPGFQSVYRFTNATFNIDFITWSGASDSDVKTLLAPFTDELHGRSINFTMKTTSSKSYYSHYSTYTAGLPYGVFRTNDIIGGRLVTRSAVADHNDDLINLYRNITKGGKFMINSIASNVTAARVGQTPGPNSVNPAWRNSLSWTNIVTDWDPASPIEDLHIDNSQLDDIEAQIAELTPGSGAYVNEARFDNPNWKEVFYGSNYDRLLEIKKKYDPEHLLYGPATVGHDYWTVESDGRLCKAH